MCSNQLSRVFHPYAEKQIKQFDHQGKKLVHYSSAHAEFLIITNRKLWMRNATLMNDFREIEYGFECLEHARSSSSWKEFTEFLDDVSPGVSEILMDKIEHFTPTLRGETYLC